MRRIVFAPSFDKEVEDIGVYIEEQFGVVVREQFVSDLMVTCSHIANFPGVGLSDHGYQTSLTGFVFRTDWIFFDYDEDTVRFLHIVDARRDKDNIEF